MQTDRGSALSAVQPAQNGLQNISKIREALPMAETGSYANLRSTILSLGGSITGDSKAELAAAAYDIVQKNIEELGLQKSSALGAQFASQMQSIKNTLANADKNPTAIKSGLDQLEPLLQHVVNYSKGLETTVNNKNDVQYKRDYDTKMNQVYDPMVLQAYNVYKNKGALEAQKFIKQHNMNPQDTATKMQNYSDLVNKGL
jgi:hypothetical protein